MKKHTHKWYETTLSRDGYGDTKSYACKCGMWKVEFAQIKPDFKIVPNSLKIEYRIPLK